MPRRMNLPGASELFRPTQPEALDSAAGQPGVHKVAQPGEPHAPAGSDTASPDASDAAGLQSEPGDLAVPHGSGRVRHDEKITVYVSIEELLALEQARLSLRAQYGMAVDRGRIVREAISSAISGLVERGEDSDLVRRLSQP